MLTDSDLPLFSGAPSEVTAAPRRHRCPMCHAGFAPVGLSQRIAEQRAAAGRGYTAEWSRFVATRPDLAAIVVDCARLVALRPRPTMDAVWLAFAERTGQALDHNHRAPAARWLMATYADLAGAFKTRERGGQVKERAR